MQFTVEELSTVKKALQVEVPAEDVSREMDAAYADLKKTVKVKGFRPGKTPKNVLKRMYGKDVAGDVSQKLVQNAFMEIMQENRYPIVGQPDIDAPELEGEGDYTFTITIEVKPEIAAIDIEGLALKKTMYAFSEGEVDGQIEMIRKNLAKKEPIAEPRAAEGEDFILIDYVGKIGDAPFEGTPATENHPYKLGRATLGKWFDEAVTGMNPGETKSFDVAYPADYINQVFAGKTVSFEVTLKEIHVEVLPEVDDEMAKNLGTFENLEALKEEIRKNLQQGYDKRIEQELNEQIFTTLIEKTEFELPEAMVDYELENIINEAERAFAANNITFEQLGQSRESIRTEYRDLAEKQVRRHLILGAIIEQQEMTVSDADLEAGYASLSAEFNQPVDLIKNFYASNAEKLDYFKHTLLEKNAIALILEKSKIEEVEPAVEEAAADASEDA